MNIHTVVGEQPYKSKDMVGSDSGLGRLLVSITPKFVYNWAEKLLYDQNSVEGGEWKVVIGLWWPFYVLLVAHVECKNFTKSNKMCVCVQHEVLTMPLNLFCTFSR